MKTGWILFLFFPLILFSQNSELNIKWSEDRLLTWEDFQALPDSLSPYSANTNSGLSFDWSYSTAEGTPRLEFKVSSNFYPAKSWVRPAYRDDEYLLAHEQVHFNISELYARKLKKVLAEYEPGINIRLDLKRIYSRLEQERKEMQRLFDRETQHSLNRQAEMRWRALVDNELVSLKQFTD